MNERADSAQAGPLAAGARGGSCRDPHATQRDRLQLDRVERVCVFRALQLGDTLCAVPALRSLRAGLPDATIVLVGLPWARDFVRRFRRYVDELIEFPGHPAFPEQPARPERWQDFVATMRSRRFDLALQLHGSGAVSNGIVAAFGAACCAGFRPSEGTASRHHLPWQPRESEVMRYVRLMRHLGLPDCGTELEWTALDEDSAELPELADCASYVCVHPGARLPSRRWPVEHFARVADRLAESGYAIVLTGSPEETGLASGVRRSMRAPAIDLCGRTSLGAAARVIGAARLLVCNDTGVSHVAAAVGTPSVVVCCGADPLRWAPLDGARHRVLYAPVACRPCMHEVCPIGHACAAAVTPDIVAEEALGLLRRAASREVLQ